MHSLISYAQNFEDVMLWRALGHIENGSYIDIGAQHPVVDSVSLAFYERGWCGVNVEPSSHCAELLREARPDDLVIQAAVNSKAGVLSFYDVAGGGLSTCDLQIAKKYISDGIEVTERLVPCVTLDDVFASMKFEDVHWLKIDVEGAEKQALQGWRKSKTRPWIVVIESTLPMTQVLSHQKWERLILRKGYKFAYFDGLNRFYVALNHSELLTAFSVGPNVFDDFGLSGVAWSSWCKVVNNKMSMAEAARETDRLEFESKLQHAKLDHAEKIRLANDEVEKNVRDHAREVEELTRQLLAAKEHAYDAARAHAATEQTLGAKLTASLLDLTKAASELVCREREFSVQLAEREQTLRLDFSQEVAKRERDLGAVISKYQSEIDRIDQLLTLKVGEVEMLQLAHSEKLLNLAEAASQREQEFGSQMLALQQLADKKKAELMLDRDEKIRLIGDELEKRNKVFSEAQELLQRELATSLLAASKREQELVTQMLAGQRDVDAHRIEQMRLHDDQIRRQAGEHLDREEAYMNLVQSLKGELHTADIERRKIEQLVVEQRDALLQMKDRLSRDLCSQIQRAEQFENSSVIAESEVQSMRESFSWRITSPFRTFFGKCLSYAAVDTLQHKILNEPAPPNTPTVSPQMKTNKMSTSKPTRLPNSVVKELLSHDGGAFIELAFQTLLGRPLEQEASIYYLDRLQAGISKEQIVKEVSESKEGQDFLRSIQGIFMCEEKRVHAAASVSELLSHQDEAFINCMYQTILGRDADADGRAYYLDKLRSGSEKIQLITELLFSNESKGKRKLFRDLSNAVNPKKQKKLLSREQLSVSTLEKVSSGGAKSDITPVEVGTLEEFLTCNDELFVKSLYSALLEREPDLQGADFYKQRLVTGVPRMQLISEVIHSDECKRRQALFWKLDSVIGLPKSVDDFTSYKNKSRVLAAMCAWPLVGGVVRLAIVINKLSHLNSQHGLVTQEEIPRLVQHHLDFDYLHNRSVLDNVSNLIDKHYVVDQRLNSVMAEQLPAILDRLNELMRRQQVMETVEMPTLLQRLSELGDRQYVLETVHVPNLLQTLSDINHRQMAADHAKDNLVKVVPMALRKITRDINDLRAQSGIVDKL